MGQVGGLSALREERDWFAANVLRLRFAEADIEEAHAEWGCNCGPAALAAACGLSLDEARVLLPEFDRKRFVNITMMREAIAEAGWMIVHDWKRCWAAGERSLIRVQFGGPWIAAEGEAAQKWQVRSACMATHWIAQFRGPGGLAFVFDVNSGLVPWGEWERGVMPRIAAAIPNCDGSYHLTHSWQIERRE